MTVDREGMIVMQIATVKILQIWIMQMTLSYMICLPSNLKYL